MDLSRSLLGLSFANPLLTAAGKWAWTAEQCRQAVAGGAGGITTKSFSTLVRAGHPEPSVVHADHYTLNAVGLPSDGVEAVQQDLSAFLDDRPLPVFISVFGDTIERFAESSAALAALKPDALELNISCPNVQDDHGRPFSYDPATAAAVVKAARDATPTLPLIVKLSPNTPDLVLVALACVEAGAQALTLINTLGPGMAIDLSARQPILSNRAGGVSGAAIKPVAVRCVADVYAATGGAVPIIGVGGVSSGEDALELIMAGASLVGVGTAVLTEGYGVFGRIAAEMGQWCEREGVVSLEELRGAIHAKN